jgi:Tfp pilus assembly protein PilX
MNIMRQRHNQQGAVSLFIVVFATLLMIVITLSFIQLMLKDQQQATASDLSQSAYDSAQSGVEDAKRLLLLSQQCRTNTQAASVDCAEVTASITSNACNTVSRGLFKNAASTETMIKQDEGDEVLQQAYTCVKIQPNTNDYKGTIGVNQSNIVPLRGADAAGVATDFDRVKISWFTRDDLSVTATSPVVGFPTTGPNVSLPPLGARWATNYPALLRTQFMQTGTSFKLSDADSSQPGNKSNANTFFLYPSETGATTADFALDARRAPTGAPQQAKCFNSFNLSEYACSITLSLPEPIDGNVANRNAFLLLGALYNGTHYKVELSKAAGGPVLFDSVQPEVDSTGRANDMFRRVKSRIEFKSDFIYPEAAVDLEGDLCKNFIITNQASDFSDNATCVE